MGRSKGFTVVETVVALALVTVVTLILVELLRGGIGATNRGQMSAQAREHARIGLEQIESEMRQALPLPIAGTVLPPAVIFPGSGGPITNIEASAYGCSLSNCMVTTVDPANCPTVPCLNTPATPEPYIPEPASVQQVGEPSGFVIFSELKSAAGASSIYADNPGYISNSNNYVWVMYQIIPPSIPTSTPAQLVRITFPATNGLNTPLGLNQNGTNWIRNDAYFVPATAGAISVPVVTLNSTSDAMWFMVTHGAANQQSQNMLKASYDTQLFTLMSIVTQNSVMGTGQSSNLPTMTATLSSQVKVEGAQTH